jgi:hypothetical protein
MKTAGTLCAACLAVAVLWLAPGTAAAQGKPHRHGQANLKATVQGPWLRLALEGPLESFLGFERAPRNPRERDAAIRMARELRAAEKQFLPSARAGCKSMEVRLESGVLDAGLLAGTADAAAAPEPAGPAGPDQHGHADIDASYVFRCANIGALRELRVNLFDSFRGLGRIEAQMAAPGRQAGAMLTSGARVLSW